MPTTRLHCDTLVLGAGAAGLAAAANLARAGRDVLVVEARARLGGRVWTQRVPGLAAPVELGAEFIHGEAEEIFALLKRSGGAAVDVPGGHFTRRGRRLVRSEDAFERLRDGLRSPALRARDMAFDELLARTRLSPADRAFARRLAEGFNAADTRWASARAIVAEWRGGGAADAPTFRPLGGYGPALEWLAAQARRDGARFRLSTVVRGVHWRRGRVECEVESTGRRTRLVARRALVTLPLGVLQRPPGAADAVHFEPALAEKAGALALLANGPVVKVALHFREAFWEEIGRGECKDASIFQAPGADFPTTWTQRPLHTPLLAAWAGGPHAAAMAGKSRAQRIAAALRSVEQLFTRRGLAARLVRAHLHDWSADPFARGAYSHVLVGGDRARRELAAPLARTLFFAGEATSEQDAATVEGALASGRRAAREMLRDEL